MTTEPLNLAQLTVLVVEDHSLQRHVLVRTFELLGVGHVVEAENGAQALLLLGDPASRVDVVFTDLDMPTMDGLALMRQISLRAPGVGVVVLSSVERNLLSAVEWLAREQPDVACLQELKALDASFPEEPLLQAGYHGLWKGQRSWNGVAILARGTPTVELQRELPGDLADDQSRYLEAAVAGVVVDRKSVV